MSRGAGAAPPYSKDRQPLYPVTETRQVHSTENGHFRNFGTLALTEISGSTSLRRYMVIISKYQLCGEKKDSPYLESDVRGLRDSGGGGVLLPDERYIVAIPAGFVRFSLPGNPEFGRQFMFAMFGPVNLHK